MGGMKASERQVRIASILRRLTVTSFMKRTLGFRGGLEQITLTLSATKSRGDSCFHSDPLLGGHSVVAVPPTSIPAQKHRPNHRPDSIPATEDRNC